MKTLQNKVAIITGGGRGIGFGLAKAFAKAGANLVITGRNRNTLHNAKEKLESQYQINVLCIPADGANEDDVNNVINKTIKYYGKINIVVNNAQASKSGVMLKDHTKEDMKKLFKVFQCNALLILKMTLEVQQSFLLAKPVTTLPEKL